MTNTMSTMTNSSFHSMPTITRTINGIETTFELTPEEFREIGWAYDFSCACEDVYAEIDDRYDAERVPAGLIEEIASRYLHYQDNSDDWAYNLRDAVDMQMDDLAPYKRESD